MIDTVFSGSNEFDLLLHRRRKDTKETRSFAFLAHRRSKDAGKLLRTLARYRKMEVDDGNVIRFNVASK